MRCNALFKVCTMCSLVCSHSDMISSCVHDILKQIQKETTQEVIERFLCYTQNKFGYDDIMYDNMRKELQAAVMKTDDVCDPNVPNVPNMSIVSANVRSRAVRKRKPCVEFDIEHANVLINMAYREDMSTCMEPEDIKTLKVVVKKACKQIKEEACSDQPCEDLKDGYVFLEIIKYMCEEKGFSMNEDIINCYLTWLDEQS